MSETTVTTVSKARQCAISLLIQGSATAHVRCCVVTLCVITALWPLFGEAATVQIQVKSFIRKVDLTDKSQFDAGNKTCQAAMAAIVNCGVLGGEEPFAGTKVSGSYRLWSELKADVECNGDKIAKWKLDPLAIDGATEMIFLTTTVDVSPGLSASPAMSGANAQKVDFSYRMRGQPNVLANATMAAAKPRTCTFINHSISGTFSCKQGKPVVSATLAGSGFPSHKLWVNNVLQQDVKQGPFDNLWKCDAADPTMVR